MRVVLYGGLAFSDSVPDFQVFVSATGGDLTVILREGDTESIFGVTDESLASRSLFQIPKAEGMVP